MKKQGVWILAAWVLAMPVVADDMAFQGHVLDIDAGQSPAVVRAITSSRYVVHGDAAILATKARACLAAQPGVSAVTAADATRVEGDLSIKQGGFFSSLRANTRIAIVVGEGAFQILESGLTQQAAGADATPATVPAPDAGGAKLLDAVFAAEQGVVDCLYR